MSSSNRVQQENDDSSNGNGSTMIIKLSPNVIETILTTITDGYVRYDLMSTTLPVQAYYRMIIVQLLFRHHDQHVARFLKKWFQNRADPSLVSIFTTPKEMAIFFVGCVQEHYALLPNEIVVADSIAAELLATSTVVQTVCGARDTSHYGVEQLTDVAKLKFVLKVLAKCVSSQEAFERTRRQIEPSVFQNLLKRAQQLLAPSLERTHVVFNYLIKELIRKYGNDSVKFIMANEAIKWIGKRLKSFFFKKKMILGQF